jgi:hypothetical protein
LETDTQLIDAQDVAGSRLARIHDVVILRFHETALARIQLRLTAVIDLAPLPWTILVVLDNQGASWSLLILVFGGLRVGADCCCVAFGSWRLFQIWLKPRVRRVVGGW